MSLDPALRERIAGILASHRVVLFMKGTRAAPRCGFSAGAVGTLDGLLEAYHDIDVLADADLREGIKAYGNWPTIPQLYVGGELVGGSDIIQQLASSGELHALLGVAAPAHILTPSATVRRLVNMTAVTVVDANVQRQPQLL